MIQEYTLDEIAWRFEMLNDMIELSPKDILDNADILPEDNDINTRILNFATAALVYLQHEGRITVNLHTREKVADALFTATRQQCEETSWIEPDPNIAGAYGTPAKTPMPIPILFHEKGNEQYTHISLSFDFPNTNLGEFCKRMIGYLSQSYKKGINVVNLVLYMQKYFKEGSYLRALKISLPLAFIEDFWNSRSQTPPEVEELMDIVLEDDALEVYDPFMRTGTNLTFAFANKKYHAQTVDKTQLYNAMFFSAILGIDTENIKLEDCTINWDPQNCDTIIATPKLDMEVSFEGNQEPISTWTLDKVFTSMAVEGRRGLMLLPASILTSFGKAERLRHDIIESNLLDTIVLLPANLFPDTNIALAIVLLKSNREENAPVTFADFSSLYEDTDEYDSNERILDIASIKKAIDNKDPRFIVFSTTEEIRESGYEWFAPKYVQRQTDVPTGFGRFKIKDIIQKNEIFGDEVWGTKTLMITREKMGFNPFDDYQELDILTEEEDEDLEGEFSQFARTCFIIDFQDGIKTYYFEEDREEPFIRYKLLAPASCDSYHVNPDMIHIGYLRLLLFKTYYKVALEASPNNKADIVSAFMNEEVIIPLSIEEQKHIYEKEKFDVALEKARKAGLDEAIESMKQEYMMEVRMRKHDMKPFLSQLDSQAKLISFYMDKIEGNEEVVAAIRQKLTGISNAVSKLRLHLNRLTEEDIYGSPELIDPIDILKELTGTFNGYSVDLEVDKIALKEAGIESPELYISRVDLSTLATTIIENAVAHAFCGDEQNYKLLISLTFDKDKNFYVIDFTNNGVPMPLGMDKFRYGLKGEKGAKSNGSGLGGYRVKSITRHFGGDYDVFCNRANKLTTIRVTFPKHNKHEQV